MTVKEYAELHAGKKCVESREGEGILIGYNDEHANLPFNADVCYLMLLTSPEEYGGWSFKSIHEIGDSVTLVYETPNDTDLCAWCNSIHIITEK